MQRNKLHTGFTLVEMLIIAPIVVLLIGAFVATLINLTGEALSQNANTLLLNNVQAAIDEIETDVKSSGAFLATNNMTIVSPQGYDDSTQGFLNVMSSTQDALILNTLATTANPASATRGLVYLANVPNACGSSNFGQNQILTFNTVYFVKDTTLYRRILGSSNYASKACSGTTIWQKPSCTPGVTGAMCLSRDETVIQATDSLTLSLDYYANPSDSSPLSTAEVGTDAARQAALDATRTVNVKITATSTQSGRTFTQTAALRITRTGALVKYTNP